MTTALITGIGGTRSIAVMNSLRMSEEPVQIIGTDANYFNAGSFACDVSYLLPLASEPSYLTELKRIIQTEKVAIVFATVEKEVSFLATYKAEIEQETGAAVIVPDEKILKICFDKYQTQEFLRTHGFTYIPTIYSSDKEAQQRFVQEQGMPIIRKPVQGYGSRGVSVIRTVQELEASEPDPAYVLQQFIENEDTEAFYNTVLNEYTAEVFVNKDSSIAGGIILKRALHAGETIAGYRVEDDATLAYLEKVAKELTIVGPCNFQYRKHQGQVYIFEINPLFSGTTYIRAKLGFNNVELAVKSFVQNQHSRIEQSELKNQFFMRYLQESFIDPENIDRFKNEKKFSNE